MSVFVFSDSKNHHLPELGRPHLLDQELAGAFFFSPWTNLMCNTPEPFSCTGSHGKPWTGTAQGWWDDMLGTSLVQSLAQDFFMDWNLKMSQCLVSDIDIYIYWSEKCCTPKLWILKPQLFTLPISPGSTQTHSPRSRALGSFRHLRFQR